MGKLRKGKRVKISDVVVVVAVCWLEWGEGLRRCWCGLPRCRVRCRDRTRGSQKQWGNSRVAGSHLGLDDREVRAA